METKTILKRLYPKLRWRKKKKRPRFMITRMIARVRQCSWYVVAGFVLVLGWLAAHLYYYNMLVDMEYNVQEAWAQVETQWQRRYHIQNNLTRMVLEYARHERELLMRLTKLRVAHLRQSAPAVKDADGAGDGAIGAKASKASVRALRRQIEQLSPDQLNQVFPQIQFMAEQYPKLRLSENFQQFTRATIDTENQIAAQIKAYNKAVNKYTTVLMQFPGVIFGKTCGFEPYDFYLPERDKLKFMPVQLRERPSGGPLAAGGKQ